MTQAEKANRPLMVRQVEVSRNGCLWKRRTRIPIAVQTIHRHDLYISFPASPSGGAEKK